MENAQPLGSLFHCLTVLIGEKYFLLTSLNLTFQFMIISCSPAVDHYEEPGSIFLLTSPNVLGSCCWFPLKQSLLQVEEAQFLQPLLKWQVLQSPNSLKALQ